MQLFFHHTAQEGLIDIPKTIVSKRHIQEIEDYLPTGNVLSTEIVSTLRDTFPSGYFNCWGAPTPAKPYMKTMKKSDYVFLVGIASKNGTVPALCKVQARSHHL